MKDTYHGTDVIESNKRAHPDVKWRHILNETDKATGRDELTFNPEILGRLIDNGKQDAKKAVQGKMITDALNLIMP